MAYPTYYEGFLKFNQSITPEVFLFLESLYGKNFTKVDELRFYPDMEKNGMVHDKEDGGGNQIKCLNAVIDLVRKKFNNPTFGYTPKQKMFCWGLPGDLWAIVSQDTGKLIPCSVKLSVVKPKDQNEDNIPEIKLMEILKGNICQ